MDSITFELAEALCVAVSRRYEPHVQAPWVSRDRDVQIAMDALRCHLTGEPIPPYSVADVPRYEAEVASRMTTYAEGATADAYRRGWGGVYVVYAGQAICGLTRNCSPGNV